MHGQNYKFQALNNLTSYKLLNRILQTSCFTVLHNIYMCVCVCVYEHLNSITLNYRNLSLLCPLWVTSLKEYARVQIEPDIAGSQTNNLGSDLLQNATQTEIFDSMYSGLTREVILPVIIQTIFKITSFFFY